MREPAVVRVWDLPTRLFHWALAACIAGMLLTAYLPGHWIDWHARIGHAVLALLVFRLVWGFVGGRWSRFSSFLPGPRRLLGYLRDRSAAEPVGHSPLGALSVYAMLLALLAQVGTGLVSDDEIAFTGPLNRYVSSDFGLAATAWHKGWGEVLLIALVLLHLLAVVYHVRIARRTLVRPMLSGDKELPAATPASRDGAVQRLLAALVFAGCIALAWTVYRTG